MRGAKRRDAIAAPDDGDTRRPTLPAPPGYGDTFAGSVECTTSRSSVLTGAPRSPAAIPPTTMNSTWFLTSVSRIERKLPVSIFHPSFPEGIGETLHRVQPLRRRQRQHPPNQRHIRPIAAVRRHLTHANRQHTRFPVHAISPILSIPYTEKLFPVRYTGIRRENRSRSFRRSPPSLAVFAHVSHTSPTVRFWDRLRSGIFASPAKLPCPPTVYRPTECPLNRAQPAAG